jgi:hypothetical protein
MRGIFNMPNQARHYPIFSATTSMDSKFRRKRPNVAAILTALLVETSFPNVFSMKGPKTISPNIGFQPQSRKRLPIV